MNHNEFRAQANQVMEITELETTSATFTESEATESFPTCDQAHMKKNLDHNDFDAQANQAKGVTELETVLEAFPDSEVTEGFPAWDQTAVKSKYIC